MPIVQGRAEPRPSAGTVDGTPARARAAGSASRHPEPATPHAGRRPTRHRGRPRRCPELEDHLRGYSDGDAQWTAQSTALTGAKATFCSTRRTSAIPRQVVWAACYRQRYLDSEATLVDRRGALDYGALNDRFQAVQTTLTEIRDQVEGTLEVSAAGFEDWLSDLKPLHRNPPARRHFVRDAV